MGATLAAVGCSDWAAQLLQCPIEPDLPKEMSVSACHCAIWRVVAGKANTVFRLSAELEKEGGQDAGACSGEGLDAVCWSEQGVTLTIGTQDREGLFSGEQFRVDFDGLVEYLPKGLVVAPPALEAGEFLQIQFVVAWAAESGDSDATWFAVDVGPARLLGKALGLSVPQSLS